MGRPLLFSLVQMPLAVLATTVLTTAASLAGLVRPGAVQALSRTWSRLLLRLFRVDVRTEGQPDIPAGPAVYAEEDGPHDLGDEFLGVLPFSKYIHRLGREDGELVGSVVRRVQSRLPRIAGAALAGRWPYFPPTEGVAAPIKT